MKLSPDIYRYLVWASAVVLGAVLAVVDARAIGRRLFGAALVLIAIAGFATTVLSPFSFGSSYYMHGIIAMGGAALALGGYAAAWLAGPGRMRSTGGL